MGVVVFITLFHCCIAFIPYPLDNVEVTFLWGQFSTCGIEEVIPGGGSIFNVLLHFRSRDVVGWVADIYVFVIDIAGYSSFYWFRFSRSTDFVDLGHFTVGFEYDTFDCYPRRPRRSTALAYTTPILLGGLLDAVNGCPFSRSHVVLHLSNGFCQRGTIWELVVRDALMLLWQH